MYAFLSLYPDVFTTHLLFNAHTWNQLTGSCNSLFKKGSNDCYDVMIELNISSFAKTKFNLMTVVFTRRYCYSY